MFCSQKGLRGKNKNSVQDETLNHVNISLISAPCQVPGNITRAESTDVVETDISEENGLDWSKLTKILSKMLVTKGNETSSFQFFPVK